jgi:glycosyltransferase 2 family protein
VARHLWRIAQWIIGGAIVIAAALQLATNWDALRSQPLDWNVRPAFLVASALLVWAMYAILIAAWRLVLHGWGERLDPMAAARIWTVSSLGKYLPGKVWAIAGMALMAQRAGVAGWAATGSAVILQALAVAAGGAVVAVTGTAVLEAQWPGFRAGLALLLAGSVTGLLLMTWPPFVGRLLRLVRIEPRSATPGAAAILAAAAANLVAWAGYGGAFWLLAAGLLPHSGLELGLAVGAFTASYLAGLLFLPAPGGVGIREGVMVLMLQGPLGEGGALALAIASRLLLTVTEFGAAAPFLLFLRERTRVAS